MTPEKAYDGIPPLEIPAAHHQAMRDHCRSTAPLEACGILAGRQPPRVDSIYPLRNALHSQTRYDADPHDLIRAIQTMRARGEAMLAIYHSHPASPAVPSRVDLEQNHYGPLPRLIVSLQDPEPVVRNWRLDAGAFVELPWIIQPPSIEPERPHG